MRLRLQSTWMVPVHLSSMPRNRLLRHIVRDQTDLHQDCFRQLNRRSSRLPSLSCIPSLESHRPFYSSICRVHTHRYHACKTQRKRYFRRNNRPRRQTKMSRRCCALVRGRQFFRSMYQDRIRRYPRRLRPHENQSTNTPSRTRVRHNRDTSLVTAYPSCSSKYQDRTRHCPAILAIRLIGPIHPKRTPSCSFRLRRSHNKSTPARRTRRRRGGIPRESANGTGLAGRTERQTSAAFCWFGRTLNRIPKARLARRVQHSAAVISQSPVFSFHSQRTHLPLERLANRL